MLSTQLYIIPFSLLKTFYYNRFIDYFEQKSIKLYFIFFFIKETNLMRQNKYRFMNKKNVLKK